MASVPIDTSCAKMSMSTVSASEQGLTLVNFSAQLEPFLTQNTPRTPPNTPQHSLTLPKQPIYAPHIPQEALTLSRTVDECKTLPATPW